MARTCGTWSSRGRFRVFVLSCLLSFAIALEPSIHPFWWPKGHLNQTKLNLPHHAHDMFLLKLRPALLLNACIARKP